MPRGQAPTPAGAGECALYQLPSSCSAIPPHSAPADTCTDAPLALTLIGVYPCRRRGSYALLGLSSGSLHVQLNWLTTPLQLRRVLRVSLLPLLVRRTTATVLHRCWAPRAAGPPHLAPRAVRGGSSSYILPWLDAVPHAVYSDFFHAESSHDAQATATARRRCGAPRAAGRRTWRRWRRSWRTLCPRPSPGWAPMAPASTTSARLWWEHSACSCPPIACM